MKKIPQTIYRWLGLLLITLLASCENVDPSVLITSAAQSPAGTPLTLQPTPLSKAFVCPITIGNGSAPPGVSDWPPGPTSHGNGALWTEFWPNNTVFAGPGYVRSDGDIDMKWPWWREVRGTLVIVGRRLDAPAPQLQSSISTAYGSIGFQPSSIIFPTAGCWEITGSVGEASLTFVTLVVKVSQ